MRRILAIGAVLFALFGAQLAHAADSSVPNMTAGGGISDTDLMYCAQAAGTLDRKCTPLQLANYIFGKVSGDLTCTSTGGCTVTKTNGTSFGSFATQSAPTGSTQCLHANSSGVVTGTGADCGAGGGSGVTQVNGGVGISVTNPTGPTVTISAAVVQRNNTTTSDTLTSSDAGNVVTENNASPVTVNIAQAGTTGFENQKYWTVKNEGAGLVTIVPATSTLDVTTIKQGQNLDFYSDGTNYWALPGRPTNVACADVTGSTCTVASGTAALGTSAIASGACAAAVIVSAPNVATTDTVTASFNADPTAVTGYIPATTGMLTIVGYPTAGNVNWKVCNNTSASITPGAITLNWRVVR